MLGALPGAVCPKLYELINLCCRFENCSYAACPSMTFYATPARKQFLKNYTAQFLEGGSL